MRTAEGVETLSIKSYFARTVDEAVEQARRELGPEALLMNCREAPPEARHLGECEVVFASAPRQDAEKRYPPPLEQEIAALRSQMAELRHSVAKTMRYRTGNQYPPETLEAYERLVETGVEVDFARDLVESVENSLRILRRAGDSQVAPEFRAHLRAELERRIPICAGLSGDSGSPVCVALVGPPGVGKTTTLVKIAVRCGLAARKSVQLVSMDTYRIGGADQLRSFAAILGVGFHAVETTLGLEAALEQSRTKDLVLIDTPGFSESTWEDGRELRAWFAAHNEIAKHLVVSASTRTCDLKQSLDRFMAFRPSRLIFTKLDETQSWGAMISESARTRLPLSFLSTGQVIPEDLATATADMFIDAVLRPGDQEARSAA